MRRVVNLNWLLKKISRYLPVIFAFTELTLAHIFFFFVFCVCPQVKLKREQGQEALDAAARAPKTASSVRNIEELKKMKEDEAAAAAMAEMRKAQKEADEAKKKGRASKFALGRDAEKRFKGAFGLALAEAAQTGVLLSAKEVMAAQSLDAPGLAKFANE